MSRETRLLPAHNNQADHLSHPVTLVRIRRQLKQAELGAESQTTM